MFRRRIIQGLALVILALCVLAWERSYRHHMRLWYAWDQPSYAVGVNWGRLYVARMDGFVVRGWHWGQTPAGDWGRWDAEIAARTFAGFSWCGDGFFEVTLPLWFPTAICGVLIPVLWRKGRRRVAETPKAAAHAEISLAA